MNLVVDTNVLIAALIKGNYTKEILLSDMFHLFAPTFMLAEIEKYKKVILEKTNGSSIDFTNLLTVFKQRIQFVELSELEKYVQVAEKVTPDPNDMLFIALALKLNCPIWSNDKKLKEQSTVRIIHTHELMECLS